jgi:hypothetical protein
MSDKQRKLKEQLMDHYSQALDELFADCSKDDDFVKFEEQVEKLASKTLPATLSALAAEREIFPPVPRLRREGTKERSS